MNLPKLSFASPAFLGFLAIGAVMLSGCPATGVGDPCSPEAAPSGGFVSSEAYLETSSVQCRTRICMVYRLDGDPSQSFEDCINAGGSASDCADHPNQETLDERVFCTCRCAGGGDSNTPVCECPEGFECTEILNQGGVGIRGSYCVNSAAIAGE